MPQWLIRLLENLGLEAPVFLGGNLWGLVYKITPEMAARMLDRNTKNRRKKKAATKKYQDDIENGRWKLNHQAIAFDNKGILSDGQNRLQAVIDSKKSVNSLVVFGVPEDSRVSIDTGVTRSSLDAALFVDVDTTWLELGTAKNVFNGFDNLPTPVSNAHALELLKVYRDGLNFVWTHLEKVKGITTSAAVRGAIVRAYYHCNGNEEDLERLARFCSILNDGQYGNIKKDRVAVQLRDKLLGEKYYGRKRLAYGLTEKAISFFMEEKVVSRLIVPDHELFPFEDELDVQGLDVQGLDVRQG